MPALPESVRRASRALPTLLAAALVTACGDDPIPPVPDGSLTVDVTTTGDSPDADGYTVTVGSADVTLPATGSTVLDLDPGSYDVTLRGVAANCAPVGDATRPVTVPEAGSVSVSFEVTCVFDAAGVALTEVSCPALAPATLEGMPFDRIALGTVPAGFERPVMARASWDGGPRVSPGLTIEEGDVVHLTVPLHPSGSLEGGDVTIRITDESQRCAAFAFSILPLPSADGELEALVDVAQSLLDEQAVHFGTTRGELLGTPMAELEPGLVPLAVAQVIVDAPGNEASLRAAVDGAGPDFGATELDFAERVLARTGLRADLEAELAAVLAPAAARAPGAEASRAGPSRALSPGLALECLASSDAMDAELLDECMTLARDKAQGTASQRTQEGAIFAMETAAILGSRTIARPIGLLIEFSQIYDAALAGNLPSSFVSIDVTPAPASFLEDQPGPGSWSPAEVTAVSTGWSLESLLSQLVLARITPEVRPSTRRLNGAERQTLIWFGGPVGDALQVENTFQGLLEELLEVLVEHGIDLGDEYLQVPPITFGPVDVSDTEWTDSRIVTGTAVELISHEQYEPREPGTSLLEVITAVGKFGGTSIVTEHVPITVGQLDLTIQPTERLLRPGEEATFTVTVTDAQHPDSVERLVPDQGTSELTLGAANVHTLTYTAPDSPEPGSTVLVSVRHAAQGGARANGAEARATAFVRFGGIDLLPVLGCVSPGQEVQLEVDTVGLGADAELVWESSAGSVDTNGLFTAPEEPGTVSIRVHVAGQPDFQDSLDLTIGGCTCSFTLQVGSNPPYVGQPGDEVSYFAPEGAIPGAPYAIGSVSFENVAGFGAIVGVEFPTTVADAPGVYPLSAIGGGLGYGAADEFYDGVDPPQGTLRIDEYAPHTKLVGEVVGGVVRDAFDSEAPEEGFSAVFQIYPPEGSLGWTYSCVIPGPEGG